MILLIQNIYMYLHLSQFCVTHYHYIIFILTLLHAHHNASFLTNTRVRFHYLTAVIMKNWNICPMTNISTQKRVLFLKPTVHLRCFFFLGHSLETPHWYIYDLSWPSEWVILSRYGSITNNWFVYVFDKYTRFMSSPRLWLMIVAFDK